MTLINRMLALGGIVVGATMVALGSQTETPAAAPSGVAAVSTASVSEPTPTTSPATLPANHDVFLRAINEQWILQFNYGGHARVCEPHSYGISSTGEAILHVYQTAGSSGSRPPPGWRTFTVSGISDVVLTQRRFRTVRKDYTDQRPALDPTWAEVPAPESDDTAAAQPTTTTRTISVVE